MPVLRTTTGALSPAPVVFEYWLLSAFYSSDNVLNQTQHSFLIDPGLFLCTKYVGRKLKGVK